MSQPIECVRCGEAFDSLTARTMHVIRRRCPEIDTEADADAADNVHAIEEVFR